MADNRIRISRGRIIPIPFSVVGTFLLFIVYIFLLENLSAGVFAVLGILISPALPILWTTRQILEIDPNNKKIWEYAWVMGGKFGQPAYYEGIDKLFMNATNSSQQMTSWGGNVHTAVYHEYVGFIKFSDGRKIELVRDSDKDYVLGKLDLVAKKLQTTFVDQTIQE